MDIVLQLTRECNLACDYCYADTAGTGAMSFETAKTVIDQFFPAKGKLVMGFFGGEPLLAYDVMQQVSEYLDAKVREHRGVKLSKTFTTNGHCFTAEVANWLKANRFEMGLSLDGTREMHETHRKTKAGGSSYDLALATWHLALERKIPVMPIMVVTPQTARYLADSVRFFIDELRAKAFSISPDLKANWPADAQTEIASQLEQVLGMVKASYIAGRPITISMFDEKIKTRKLKGKPARPRCRFGQGKISVATDGAIFPCEIIGSSMPGELCIGQAGEPLDENRIVEFKRTLAKPASQCEGCDEIARCHYWCGCKRFLGAGTLAEVPEALCFFQKLSCELGDRMTDQLLAAHCRAYYAEYCVPERIKKVIAWVKRPWSKR
jgi:uncharacterized protein